MCDVQHLIACYTLTWFPWCNSVFYSSRPPRLKNIDRSSATSMEVTVGNVTVIITDYKPKKERTSSVDTQNNNSTSNSAVTSPVHSPTAVKTEMNGDTDTEDRS